MSAALITSPGIADPYGVVPTIEQVAASMGVDPALAVADAEHESGLNPGALGDNGTSVGLFQLHWGGELNQLGSDFPTAEQAALDPATNARVALGQFAAVAAANPGADPGRIAALAERPADPTAYAASVDQLYGQARTAGIPTSTATLTGFNIPKIPNPFGAPIPGIINGLGGAASSAVNGTTNAVGKDLLEAVFLFAGAGLVVLGAWRMASPKVTQAADTAVKAAPLAAAVAA